jgi:hypothetical protein
LQYNFVFEPGKKNVNSLQIIRKEKLKIYHRCRRTAIFNKNGTFFDQYEAITGIN